jgi:DNA-binding protein
MATLEEMLKVNDQGIFTPSTMPTLPARPVQAVPAEPVATGPLDAMRAKAAKMGLKSDPTYTPPVADAPALRELQQLKDYETPLDYTPPAPPPSNEPVSEAGGDSIATTEGQAAQGQAGQGSVQTPSLIPTAGRESGVEYAPGTEMSLSNAFDDTQEVTNDIKEIMKNADEETKKYFANIISRSVELESFLDPASEGFQTFKRNVSEAKNKIEMASQDLADFQKNAKVDPNRYYKETPFLNHAMNSVAMLFEGNTAAAMIRAGLPAPTGMVQQRIDRAISDDISRQKDEMRSKEAGMSNTINRYRDNLKLLGDERAAEYKTRAELYSQAVTTLNAVKAKFGPQVDVKNIEKLQADNEFNYQKSLAEMGKKMVETTFGLPVAPKTDTELTIFIPGAPPGANAVKALTVEDAKDLKKKSEASLAIARNIKKLKDIRGNTGAWNFAGLPDEKQAEARTIVADLWMNLKDSYGMGAFDTGTQDFLKMTVPTPDALGHVMGRYEAILKTNAEKYADALSTRTQGGNKYNPDLIYKALNAHIAPTPVPKK